MNKKDEYIYSQMQMIAGIVGGENYPIIPKVVTTQPVEDTSNYLQRQQQLLGFKQLEYDKGFQETPKDVKVSRTPIKPEKNEPSENLQSTFYGIPTVLKPAIPDSDYEYFLTCYVRNDHVVTYKVFKRDDDCFIVPVVEGYAVRSSSLVQAVKTVCKYLSTTPYEGKKPLQIYTYYGVTTQLCDIDRWGCAAYQLICRTPGNIVTTYYVFQTPMFKTYTVYVKSGYKISDSKLNVVIERLSKYLITTIHKDNKVPEIHTFSELRSVIERLPKYLSETRIP